MFHEPPQSEPGTPVRAVSRHRAIVRVTHAINAVVLFVLLLSGLQIFNAHPALYWGDRSDPERAVLKISAVTTPSGARGVTRVAGHSFGTTGVLGVSRGADGRPEARAFPTWATIPGERWLAMGRRWHFFFAWLLVFNAALYLLYSVATRHLQRDLLPSRADMRHMARSVWDHLRLRFPRGEAALRYNPIQKLSYLVVIFGFGGLMVLTGLAMSPWIDSIVPLSAFFGGRQSARTIHFLVAFGLLGFTLVHLVMIALVGPWNHLRAMITGRYVVKTTDAPQGGVDAR